MSNNIYQCNHCGVVMYGIDYMTLHVATVHYHNDVALSPVVSKRLIKKMNLYTISPKEVLGLDN